MSMNLKELLSTLAGASGISEEFIAASDHPYMCRCDKCLAWWTQMPPEVDDDNQWSWGPFTRDEIIAAGGRAPEISPDEYYKDIGGE